MSEIQKEMIPLYLTFTFLSVIFIFFIVAVMIRMKARQLRAEQDMLRALIAERERTMYTISVELHNNANQLLSLVKMTVRMMEINGIPEQKKYIDQSLKLLDTLILDMSNISHSLNSDFLKTHGLYEFLRKESEWINLSKEVNCRLEVGGALQSFPEETELIIIRMVQEAIQNSLKHSEAKHIVIDMEYGVAVFTLCISDDGKGFALSEEAPKGMGLQSLYNRAKIIGSDVFIKSGQQTGTKITFTIRKPKYIESTGA